MGKRIILLLVSILAILIMMQNNASVWLYIGVLIAIMALWNMIED